MKTKGHSQLGAILDCQSQDSQAQSVPSSSHCYMGLTRDEFCFCMILCSSLRQTTLASRPPLAF